MWFLRKSLACKTLTKIKVVDITLKLNLVCVYAIIAILSTISNTRIVTLLNLIPRQSFLENEFLFHLRSKKPNWEM